MWCCGVDVLFRIISAYMDVIRAPMMMGFRCVSFIIMLVLCVNVFFVRLPTDKG